MPYPDRDDPHLFPISADTEARPGKVPGWAVIGIFVILLFFFIAQARGFLMPVTLAVLLFFVFVPFRRWMERMGIGATVTAAVVTVGLVIGVIGVGFAISGPIQRMVAIAPEISARLEARISELRANFHGLEEAAAKLDELSGSGTKPEVEPVAAGPGQHRVTGTITTDPTPQEPNPADQQINVQVTSPSVSSTLMGALSFGPEIVGQIIFTLFMLFFLLASGDLMYLKIVQSFDTMRDKRGAYLALREIEDSLGTYLGAITLINACLGAIMGMAMWAWGMPSPLLLGLACFLLNYIPYLGPIAGVAIAFVVALMVQPDIWTALMIAGTYWLICGIEGQLITPFLVSSRLELNTVVVFLTVALWAWLWSILGMVVAVPMLVVLRVLSAHIPSMQKFGNFLAGEDPPPITEGDEEPQPTVT